MCASALAVLGTVNLWKVSSVQDRFPVDLTLAAAALVAALIASSLVFGVGRLEGRSWIPLTFAFATFLPATIPTSEANPYSVQKVSALFTSILLVLAAPTILLITAQRRRIFLLVVTGIGFVLSAWLIVGGSTAVSGRVQIDNGNPIALGRMTAVAFVTCAVAALGFRGRRRWVAVTGMAISAVATVSTGSRGPLAAAVIGVLLVVLLSRHHRSRLVTVAGLVSLTVAAGVAVSQFAPEGSLDRIGDATGGASDAFRGHLISESLAVILAHPEGVGWGLLGDHLSSSARSATQGYTQYPHNVLLEVAAEGGLLALVGLIVLLWVSWRRMRTAAVTPVGQALLAVWVMSVVSAMTSSDVIGNRLMWMMIGIGIATPLVIRKMVATPGVGGPKGTSIHVRSDRNRSR